MAIFINGQTLPLSIFNQMQVYRNNYQLGDSSALTSFFSLWDQLAEAQSSSIEKPVADLEELVEAYSPS